MRDLVTLVSMPWESVYGPSIQLGTLRALLSAAGIPVTTRSCNLDFLAWCRAGPSECRLSAAAYDALARTHGHTGLPEWVFAVPPYLEREDERSAGFAAALSGTVVPEPLARTAAAIREHVPGFLESCADTLLAARPRVVGFSLTHCQNVPSLALARVLKSRAPALTIVFGGANCEGPMGAALHRAFPWVDLVVRGEAERVLPRLLLALLRDGRVEPVPGLCYRDADGGTVELAPESEPVRMEEVPLPDYADWFAQLGELEAAGRLLTEQRVPYESARGCWWGQKSHCRFCGISADSMPFRSKPAARVVEEMLALAARHRVLDFALVDYILDPRYFKDALPALRDAGVDLRVFLEVKANLRREQVRMLREAGVNVVQPGMESLSTPVLKLLGKGVTAFQNVRLLKWCEEYGVKPTWNLLTGIPLEPVDEYARMAELMPALYHLEPPTVTEIAVYRFSPYHRTPRELGIEVIGPFDFYEALYPVAPALREDIAYFFEHRYLDGRDPRRYTAPVREAAAAWQAARRAGASLRYWRGPGFLQVVDTRPRLGPACYTFGETEARIYLGCEDGAVAADLLAKAGPGYRLDDVKAFLDGLVADRLVFEESGRYLSLALPATPRADAPARARERHAAGPPGHASALPAGRAP